jgi:hypothetical protein
MVGEIERVLAALNREGVRYLVAGGVAVVLHGYLRTTADLDLVLELEPENVRKAIRALEAVGYQPRAPVSAEDFADSSIRERWIREKNLEVFSMWSRENPLLEVDLLAREPLDFEDAYARATPTVLKTTTTRVVPLPLLIDEAEERPPDGSRGCGSARSPGPGRRARMTTMGHADSQRPSWTFEEHRRAQARRGLELTPAERLTWLEATVEELRPLVGRAREPHKAGNSLPDEQS